MTPSEEDLRSMRQYRRYCIPCCRNVKKDYCRDCDEFFETRHVVGCTMAQSTLDHSDHRTIDENRQGVPERTAT